MSKKHMGSGIDDFLKEEGIFEEAQAQAIKEVVAWQLAEAMKKKKISKARMATLLDYEIIVCDPRPELIAEWTIEGVTLIQGMPDDVIRAQPALNHTAILALTHDPRIDDMGLMEALTTDAFYIGAMGSERTSENRRKRMLLLDVSEQQLGALHAPVGLPIGSKTPAEIALSILAEITRKRSLRARS